MAKKGKTSKHADVDFVCHFMVYIFSNCVITCKTNRQIQGKESDTPSDSVTF
jgi:hypothetical protein